MHYVVRCFPSIVMVAYNREAPSLVVYLLRCVGYVFRTIVVRLSFSFSVSFVDVLCGSIYFFFF